MRRSSCGIACFTSELEFGVWMIRRRSAGLDVVLHCSLYNLLLRRMGFHSFTYRPSMKREASVGAAV